MLKSNWKMRLNLYDRRNLNKFRIHLIVSHLLYSLRGIFCFVDINVFHLGLRRARLSVGRDQVKLNSDNLQKLETLSQKPNDKPIVTDYNDQDDKL
jgi:hypothetical protein